MPPELSRRDVFAAGLGLLSLPISSAISNPPRSRSFRLIETAGLRRFGYPVHTILTEVENEKAFLLTRAGKPVPAQFRAIVAPDGRPAVAIDFNTSPGPLETEDYVVEFGRSGSESTGGMFFERRDGFVRVANGTVLHFDVPADLSGLLRSVGNSGQEFVEAGGKGLFAIERSGRTRAIGGPSTIVDAIRQGPTAVGLRFRSAIEKGGAERLPVIIDMTCPRSKSWVEVTVGLDDPDGQIASLNVDLKLKLEGSPTLIDFGALGTVYGQIKGEESMALIGGGAEPPWTVLQGPKTGLKPFAKAPADANRPAEGWAHVMDRTRCTAVAVAGFGRTTTDRIDVGADGRLGISRRFPEGGPGRGRKSLTFWLHFVGMPVQVGAATSPQAMLAPLRVVWTPAS